MSQRALHCAACGATFSCGRDAAQCWCSTLPALPAARLDANRDCLCPRCLRVALDDAESAQNSRADAAPSVPDPADRPA